MSSTAAAKHIEQLQAKLTCMCGDYVDHHSMGSGHSPISMYDYSQQNLEDENKQLKAEIDRLKNRIEQVFP